MIGWCCRRSSCRLGARLSLQYCASPVSTDTLRCRNAGTRRQRSTVRRRCCCITTSTSSSTTSPGNMRTTENKPGLDRATWAWMGDGQAVDCFVQPFKRVPVNTCISSWQFNVHSKQIRLPTLLLLKALSSRYCQCYAPRQGPATHAAEGSVPGCSSQLQATELPFLPELCSEGTSDHKLTVHRYLGDRDPARALMQAASVVPKTDSDWRGSNVHVHAVSRLAQSGPILTRFRDSDQSDRLTLETRGETCSC